MWLRDVGCLAVLDEDGHVVGMVTDRDLCMAAYTQGKPLFAIPVSIAMSREGRGRGWPGFRLERELLTIRLRW
jgi:CBS domain-containing protein